MNSDSDPAFASPYPPPDGVKLRTRKIGASPMSRLVPTPVSQPGALARPGDRPPFRVFWEDLEHGLELHVVEDNENGRLGAEVFCTDATQLNKLALSVALVGTKEFRMIRKTILLDTPKQGGCGGSADFGTLNDATSELGAELGIVVFMLA